MHVLLNPHCDHGRGGKKWARIASDWQGRFGDCRITETHSTEGLVEILRGLVREGEQTIVAAGGDGTVHWILNALLSLPRSGPERAVSFGAVGLGSSNDFHKPFRPENAIRGIPVRLDAGQSRLQDLIEVRWEDETGGKHARFCVNNAGLGITAEGNRRFSAKGPVIGTLQHFSVEAAIAASAVWTIFSYRNRSFRIQVDDRPPFQAMLTNLGILKNPYFGGGLHYDLPIAPDDGRLCICLSESMSRFQAVRTLVRLYQGRFKGLPGTASWTASRVSVVAGSRCFALEMDGEVVQARKADFKVVPKAVRCCA